METIVLENVEYKIDDVIDTLESEITEERKSRIQNVVGRRSTGVITILEDLYDRGNVSAVMRSIEAMGYLDVHLIEKSEQFKKANRVTKGADKWINVRKWVSTSECVQGLKSKGIKIYATHLQGAVPISDLDFSDPCAIVLGNEADGISEEMAELADQNFIIPMQGFVQSFNISVAAAICLYHARSAQDQLKSEGKFVEPLEAKERRSLYADYLYRAHLNPQPILKRKLTI